MNNKLAKYGNPFDEIRKIDQRGSEYWSAREIYKLFHYTRWEDFKMALARAFLACKNSDQNPKDHMHTSTTTVIIGSGATRQVEDYQLTRYACYLLAMNCDVKKERIALAQTYFAIQARNAELTQSVYNVSIDAIAIALHTTADGLKQISNQVGLLDQKITGLEYKQDKIIVAQDTQASKIENLETLNRQLLSEQERLKEEILQLRLETETSTKKEQRNGK